MRMSKKEIGIVVAFTIALTSISFVYAETNGMPFNELWDAIFGVQGDVDSLEEQLEEALETIADLEERLSELESNPTGGGLPGMPEPDYDSGWCYDIEPYGEMCLDHDLGTHEILVYIIGSYYDDSMGLHIWHPASGYKFIWRLDMDDSDAIQVINTSGDYEDFRLLIWALPPSS